MARQEEFEDMRAEEWPYELHTLQGVASNAWSAYAELDNLLNVKTYEDRGHIVDLAGRAWTLLRDIRAEGMRQLAAWEEEQKAEEEGSLRKQRDNWNAVADGLQPPYPSEY